MVKNFSFEKPTFF